MKTVVWTLDDISNMIKKRQMNEFDNIIMMDGARGSGKSSLAWKILMRTGNFKPDKDLMFTRDEVMEAMRTRKYSCIDADEMINSAHNREFFSGDQRNFIKQLNMFRDNYNILIGSVPFFYDLDPQVRKLVKLRITCIKRGTAIIQMSKNSLYTNDPWDTNVNKKIEESWINKIHKGVFVKPRYQRLTTYIGHIFFTKLPKLSEIRYKKLKQFKRDQMQLGEEETKKEYYQEANELIETGRVKSFKELRFWLMGKGILYTKGTNKIKVYRKDMGFEKSMKETFGKKEDREDDDFTDDNISAQSVTDLIGSSTQEAKETTPDSK